jgi:TetR/AcrR family transcriptional regulator, mexJK operon transcriptional repressor
MTSERKHDAIARAALQLFGRDGYERTSVDAIAAEAGVSKRTVYSHYGDKENLFLAVIRSTYELMRERVRDIAGRTLTDVDDVQTSLISCASEIIATISRSPERAMLLRVVLTEMPHFPALSEMWRSRGITSLLAEPLARLTAAGQLRADDPTLAAEHLSALTFGQVNNSSMMGTFDLSDAEVDRIINGGVHVFLAAYGPQGKQHSTFS